MTQNLPKPSPESYVNGTNGTNGRAAADRSNRQLPPPPPARFSSLDSQPELNLQQPGESGATTSIPSEKQGANNFNQYPTRWRGIALNSQQHSESGATASIPSEKQRANNFSQYPTRWRGNAWRFSLKKKAMVLAIAIGTLPVLLIGSGAYYLANQALTSEITESQLDHNVEIADKIAFYMRERYGDIQIMSNVNVFTDPQLRQTTTRLDKQAALDQFIKAYPIYNSIAIFDLNGNVLAQSQGQPLGNHKDRAYFQKVLQTNQPVISEPEISKSAGTLSIHTAAPVKDKVTGQTIAIARARLPVTNLHDLLATIAQGHEGERDAGIKLYLSDRAGDVFAGSSEDYKDLKKVVSATSLFPGFTKLNTADEAGVDLQTDQVITYAPFKKYTDAFRADLPDLGWSTIATVDKSIAFTSQRQLLLALLTGTGLAAVAVGALAAWIANRAVRPIVAAANATEEIGRGNLNSRLEVVGEDELATLGENINTMAVRLQETLQEQEMAADKARFLTSVTAESRAATESDLKQIFDQALTHARSFLNVDRVVVYRFKPNWSGYISNESVAAGFAVALNDKIEDPCIPQQLLDAYRNGRVVPTNDVFNANFHPEHVKLMERLQIRANLVVPILNQGRLFGLLVAHHCSQPYVWQQAEVDFMTQLATQLGVAVSVQEVEAARTTAEVLAAEQTQLKEGLQRRALDLLMAVDPVSRGDLTVRAQVTEDEIGTVADSYNATIASLRKIVLQVQDAAQQVVSTTNTNEVAIRDLSTGAIQQTAEISAALDRIQEMANSIRVVAANAQKAETAVQQASQTVQAGDAAMNRTVEGILAIRETVGETAKKVKRLGESSQKISKVVNLIGTFAAQTNLLALNASIEAARAGEEGRGFAVVADEVRSLARQSAEATAEIEKLVASIQAETNEVVAAMEAGTEQVVAGTQLVDETRQNLTQIAAVSNQINELVNSIAQAAQMQSQASESVTKTMTDVASIADQTSTEATQVSNSFKQLLDVAQALQAEVGQFKVR